MEAPRASLSSPSRATRSQGLGRPSAHSQPGEAGLENGSPPIPERGEGSRPAARAGDRCQQNGC